MRNKNEIWKIIWEEIYVLIMRNKSITYRFSYSTICITLLFRDWWILPHTQRIQLYAIISYNY